MQWIWTSAPRLALAAIATFGAIGANATEPLLSGAARLERSLEKHSADGRFALDARLTPGAVEQRSERFSLRNDLAPKATSTVCASGDGLFINGFETL